MIAIIILIDLLCAQPTISYPFVFTEKHDVLQEKFPRNFYSSLPF